MAASPTGPLSGIRVIDVHAEPLRPDGDEMILAIRAPT
jgi:hypothetical protein